MNMTIQEKIQAGLVFFDGGTGTMLQEAGLAERRRGAAASRRKKIR